MERKYQLRPFVGIVCSKYESNRSCLSAPRNFKLFAKLIEDIKVLAGADHVGTRMFCGCYSNHRRASQHAPALLQIHRGEVHHICTWEVITSITVDKFIANNPERDNPVFLTSSICTPSKVRRKVSGKYCKVRKGKESESENWTNDWTTFLSNLFWKEYHPKCYVN